MRSISAPARLLALTLVAAAFLSPGSAPAQARRDPIVLEHADSLVGMVIGGENARQLIGNVRFTQGNLTLECGRAIQYLATNRVYFEGMVQARDDSVRMVGQRALYHASTRMVEAFDRVLLEEGTTTLQSRYGTYSADTRQAYFREGVIVADTSTILTAGQVRYDRDRQFLSADSAVRIEDLRNGVITLSDSFENDRAARRGRWRGNPRLLRISGGGDAPAETLTVAGAAMESRDDSVRRLIVRDSVRIFRGGLTGVAGVAEFHPDRDSMALHRSPWLWYRDEGGTEHQVAGDTVTMALRGRHADRVVVSGNALAASEAGGGGAAQNGGAAVGARYNQLAGQRIILYFDGNRLGGIDVLRTATSLYYLYEEGRPNGLNRASGNGVTIRFGAGRVESITMAENVEGKYIPERLVRGQEAEYHLPGFRWRADRPAPPK